MYDEHKFSAIEDKIEFINSYIDYINNTIEVDIKLSGNVWTDDCILELMSECRNASTDTSEIDELKLENLIVICEEILVYCKDVDWNEYMNYLCEKSNYVPSRDY